MARDRGGQTADFVTGTGSVSAKILASTLEPLLSNDALLVSDGAPAYKCFARANNITHEAINANKKQRVRGTYHIQNVNGYHGRFKQWVDRFNGVATKYLGNYLGWRRALEKYPQLTSERLLFSALGQY